MNKIAFMSANFVARQIDYRMTGGWAQGDRAANDYYRPAETFAGRFRELLETIRSLGFGCADIWTAHLNWAWATERHLREARDLLAAAGVEVAGYAGGFGATRNEFEAACRTAVGIGAKILGGNCPFAQANRAEAAAILADHDLRLAFENHPEKTPAALLERIGDGAGGRLGAAVDTGWFGTQGYAASKAIRELAPHLLQVHLKDVREAGAHHTCAYGDGCVDIPACVDSLKKIGYAGAITLEHEPETYDPSEECRKSLVLLQQWLG